MCHYEEPTFRLLPFQTFSGRMQVLGRLWEFIPASLCVHLTEAFPILLLPLQVPIIGIRRFLGAQWLTSYLSLIFHFVVRNGASLIIIIIININIIITEELFSV